MKSLDEISQTWLDQQLIPKLKTYLQKTNCTVNYHLSFLEELLFMSHIFFLELTFSDNDKNKSEKISLVVKRSNNTNFFYDAMDGDANFHNEILFYTKFAKNYEDYPRCFYAEEKLPNESVVVTENINQQGYYLTSQKFNLGTEFVLPAFHEVGKLHARAYILKEKCPEEFFKIVNSIQPTKFQKSENSFCNMSVNGTATRGLNYLRKNKYDESFCDKMETLLKNAFDNVVLEFLKPKEPLATLCHGDYTRNNVFFQENGIIQAKLIDFGMLLYCSPAIDLSTFLCLSSSRINITDKFHEVFDAYHETVMKCLEEANVENLERFSRHQLLEDFKKHALFGYVISMYFLPYMISPDGQEKLEVLQNGTPEELIKRLHDYDGENISKISADMLLDLKALGCLDHILHQL